MTLTTIAAFLAAGAKIRTGGEQPREPEFRSDGFLLFWLLTFAVFVAVITVAAGRA